MKVQQYGAGLSIINNFSKLSPCHETVNLYNFTGIMQGFCSRLAD
jgi:hypothetical protein